VLAAAVVLVPSAAATPRGLKLLVRDGNRLALLYLDRVTPFRQPLTPTPGELGFSGDGRLISIGGTIVGRARLPGANVVWGPTGERAAVTTDKGGVVVWTPAGRRVVVPNGWNAQSLAWSRDGALAIGRIENDRRRSLWIWRDGRLTERVGPLGLGTVPLPFAWTNDGSVLWWAWPDSSSVGADGVGVYRDGTRIGTMLMYRDWVAVCGRHLAFVAGRDRYAMDNKTIVFDGRDVSRDPRHSWASPACTAGGRLVATASRNLIPPVLGHEHRSIWQLLPARKQLTRPPWGWTDEAPHLFPNGALLFVRVHAGAKRSGSTWRDTENGHVMLLEQGKLSQVAEISYSQDETARDWFPPQYYGHYYFSSLFSVWP
jgi:hypothetical protein